MTSTPVPARRRRFAPWIWLASLTAVILLALTAGLTMSAFTASITNTTDTATAGTLLMTETGISGVGSPATSCYSNTTATGAITTANSGSCAVINKFGGATLLTPSTTAAGAAPTGTIPATTPATAGTNQNTGVVQLTNNGSGTAATLTIGGTACGSATAVPVPPVGSSANLCPKLDVAVYRSATAPVPGTVATYGTQFFYGTAASLGTTTGLSTGAAAIPAAGSVYLTFVVWVDGSADNSYQGLSASTPITFTFSG